MKTAYAVLAGTANPALAAAIAGSLGIQLSPCHVERFPDGEVGVQIRAPVRDKAVFLLQPTSPPVNDHLIELLALADACRRARRQPILKRSFRTSAMPERISVRDDGNRLPPGWWPI
jgi:phosphoribosylpyrophosphate synthetase